MSTTADLVSRAAKKKFPDYGHTISEGGCVIAMFNSSGELVAELRRSNPKILIEAIRAWKPEEPSHRVVSPYDNEFRTRVF